jgi:hypothetical protein
MATAGIGDIKTQRSAKTMAYDPKTRRLFLSAAETEAWKFQRFVVERTEIE